MASQKTDPHQVEVPISGVWERLFCILPHMRPGAEAYFFPLRFWLTGDLAIHET